MQEVARAVGKARMRLPRESLLGKGRHLFTLFAFTSHRLPRTPPMDQSLAKRTLQDLIKRDDLKNKYCVDCGNPNPQWASLRFASFPCLQPLTPSADPP
jgi:Putative GTPase activating protein for Arf